MVDRGGLQTDADEVCSGVTGGASDYVLKEWQSRLHRLCEQVISYVYERDLHNATQFTGGCLRKARKE